MLPGELVDTKGYFSECSFANELDESIEIQSCRRQSIMFLNVRLDVFDQLLTLLNYAFIDLGLWSIFFRAVSRNTLRAVQLSRAASVL